AVPVARTAPKEQRSVSVVRYRATIRRRAPMRHRTLVFVWMAALAIVSGELSSNSGRLRALQADRAGAPAARRAKYVDGEILVRFRRDVASHERAIAHGWVGGQTARTFKHLDGLELVRLPARQSVHDALARYRQHPDVLYAERNQIVTATD